MRTRQQLSGRSFNSSLASGFFSEEASVRGNTVLTHALLGPQRPRCGPIQSCEKHALCSVVQFINPWRASATRVTVLVLCVCLSRRANLRTGASGHLTEGTSGLSGTFFHNSKAFLLKLLRYKRYKLTGTKLARVCHFVHVAMFRISLRFTSVKLVR